MAVRYYIDDSIGQPAPVQCRVVVKQPVENDLFSSPPAAAQNTAIGEITDVGQDAEVLEIADDAADSGDAQDKAVSQDAEVSQDAVISKEGDAVQTATIADGSTDSQSAELPLNAPVPKAASKTKKTASNTLTLFDL